MDIRRASWSLVLPLTGAAAFVGLGVLVVDAPSAPPGAVPAILLRTPEPGHARDTAPAAARDGARRNAPHDEAEEDGCEDGSVARREGDAESQVGGAEDLARPPARPGGGS